ncbi:MAG: type VI secretion system baseplate subunit TssG [Acetobacter sp.]
MSKQDMPHTAPQEQCATPLPPYTRLSFAVLMNLLEHKAPIADARMGAVLLRSTQSLGFPAADITDVRQGSDVKPFALEADIAFMGLYGPSSPLPTFWTERALSDDPGGKGLRDVLDLFGHVSAQLLYRGWVQSRPHVFFNRHKPQELAALLLSPAGIDVDALEPEDCQRLLRAVPLLLAHDRSAVILEKILTLCLDLPVRIEEGCLRYIELAEEDRFTLGTTKVGLGQGLRLGTKLGDISTTMAVILGPLPLAKFEAALKGGEIRAVLCRLLRLLLHIPLACRVDLILENANDGAFTLGSARLGWTSWVDPKEPVRCQTGLAL